MPTGHRTMVLSPDESFVVIAAGLDGLAIFDIDRQTTDVVLELGFTERVVPGLTPDWFAVVSWPERGDDNTWAAAGARITAHRMESPATVASTVVVPQRGAPHIEGDAGAWDHLPGLYALSENDPAWSPSLVVVGDPPRRGAFPGDELYRWLDDPEFGLDSTECPDDRHVLVQGAHQGGPAIVWDAAGEVEVARFPVGGHPGVFRFPPNRGELWSAHYDTIDRIDVTTWTTTASGRMRDRGFIAALTFDRPGRRAAASLSARGGGNPGHIFVFDVASFRVVGHASHPAGWLDDVVLLEDGRCVARTWGPNRQVVVLEPEPAELPLDPPRAAGDNVWL